MKFISVNIVDIKIIFKPYNVANVNKNNINNKIIVQIKIKFL